MSFYIKLLPSADADPRLLSRWRFTRKRAGDPWIATFADARLMARALAELRRGGWHGSHAAWPKVVHIEPPKRGKAIGPAMTTAQLLARQAELDRAEEARAKKALSISIRGR